MSRKSIIILVVITAIFGAVIFTLMQKNPGITKIIFSENSLMTEEEIESYSETDPEFDQSEQIYALLLVKNIPKGSTVDLQWKISENGTEELVQENSITLKEEGSGRIVVSLIQKNKSSRSGIYNVYVTIGELELKNSFKIK
ncbi:MAG: hypothetical protein FJW66_08295 [Actinobacteria bacterium]|nr:hypothetical protein [Actinomycetota bacterium]